MSKEITGHSDGTTTAIQDKHYITGPEPFSRKLVELSKLVMPVSIPMPQHGASAGEHNRSGKSLKANTRGRKDQAKASELPSL